MNAADLLALARKRATCRHPDPVNEGQPTIGLDTEGLVSMRCKACSCRWNIRVAPLPSNTPYTWTKIRK